MNGSDNQYVRLLEAARQLTSEHSTSVVLQRIVDLSAELTGARYAALGVLDAEGNHLSEFLNTGLTDQEREHIGHLPRGHGILGALINDPRPLKLRRIKDDERSVGFPPYHPPMTSFLGVPVRSRGEVFGNIYLTEKQGAPEFTDQDENLLILLAAQAGIAVQNARLFEANARREQGLAAGQEISNAILESRDTSQVLDLVAARARELLEADLITVASVSGGGEWLAIVSAHGNDADRLIGYRLPVVGSIAGEVASRGESRMVDDVYADPHYHPIPGIREGRLGPAVLVPMSAAGRVFGTLAALRCAGAKEFNGEDQATLERLAAQAAVALEYGHAQEQLRQLAVLEDRERIARDIHDGVIQALFAVGMNLQSTATIAGSPETAGRIAGAVAELDRVILELRHYIFGLRTELTGEQLEEALHQLVSDFRHRSGVVTVIDVDREVAVRLQAKAQDIIQMTREALSNVARHAEAATCRVSLVRTEKGAMLEIDDDGRGFDADRASAGMGIEDIRVRVRSIGGVMELESKAQAGTRIRLELPL